ncbi:hypothetical protein A0128_12335 [Leptospira tipperaryensis]|uniref:YARHG domain-containing protein n=1 Tax=Leptospira tipperaryensis TaxID=2564040 RepID=A0A1D7UYA4_9LEPT|nr:hypothetical protein A0128_12335 [Leptospira tipperaryensis]
MIAISSITSETENSKIEEIILKRNELFAKQGHKFKNQRLDAYFRKFEWYHPKAKPVQLSKKDQDLADQYLRLEKETSLQYSEFLSNRILWDDSKLEYYENVERTFLKNGSVQNQIENGTKDIHYRSEEIFITGVRISGKSNDAKLLESIRLAKNGDIEFKRYYTVTPSQDKRFYRILDCSVDSINQEICSTQYVLENEKLISASQSVPQTSYVSEWIYIYVDGSLFSTRFYFKSMGKVEKEIVVNND